MSEEKVLTVDCPYCSKEFNVELPDSSGVTESKRVRALLKPVGTVHVYRITTDEIKAFVQQKANFYREGISVEATVRYCERKNSNPHRGYAFLKIAFNENALERNQKAGWFEKIGENSDNVRFINDIFVGLVKKYSFDKDGIDDLLSNYKRLEKVEEMFGLTEAILTEIRELAIPKRVISNSAGENWIMFAARAEKIIEDMLEDPATDKVDGSIEIHDVHPISKDNIEFIVYVHPKEMKASENPYIRKILSGEIKLKD